MCEYKITVFTPTYNRGYIIDNLYQSLRRQTYKNFEWLVVDDGSTDNTSVLFELWIKDETLFPIRYYHVDNGGKHRAINKGTDIAKGEFFFIVDSDDYLTDSALEKVVEWFDTLKCSSSKFAGVAGNRGYNNNDIIGDTFDDYYIDATSLERKKNNILGDKAEIFYTSILKRFRFPEFSGENFVTESIVWDKIAADGYRIRWFNEIIYICDYLDDGLTKAGKKIFIDNPKGYAFLINEQIKLYKYSIRGRLAVYFQYYVELRASLSKKEICVNLDVNIFLLQFVIFLGRVISILRGLLCFRGTKEYKPKYSIHIK